ncbi:hypothetical protein FRACYDRAFT_266813 [Fragilariopsis cylindrus CCMP1102]|uniref:1-alkyl-2-acetylglycerophosphocholine esterase n=1 Tax=Fragilariopsis cylindrus CCMP1102 TaxID=635003 RepID=A0A1E7EIW4_9STRA|nr:hypothetical protein FRACYDRAFT_266813 [Fragilariopsis cylindrus CCMP1102]|eukprot:OEU05839.1 hypothetical protein FRACYDRAFT_266813 [Fragilariopsis cylindrus CCMP1102]
MRLLSSVTKKALLAFGYPRLNIDPTTIDNNLSNNYNSKNTASSLYHVGATKIRMSTDLPACQLFYPAATAISATTDDDLTKKKNENKNKFIPYFRKEAVTGMIDYLNGFGDGLLQMLQEKSHPCQQYYDCNPIMTTMNITNNENNDDDDDSNNTKKFPLLLFSHGLGGNMELYTELCAMIASYVPYSRQKVLDMRTPMLEQRVNELQQIYDYMATSATNEKDVPVPSSELVQQIISITNINELHLVGHSFGGATQLLAAQKWMTSNKAVQESTETDTETERIKSSATTIGTADSGGGGGIATAVVAAAPATTTTVVTTNTISNTATTKIPPIIPKSIMVLDAWCYALSDEILNNGISISVVDVDDDDDDQAQQQYPKIISILSQDWALTNQERKQTLQFLKNCHNNNNNNNVYSYYAKDSVHQSFSDTECWLPTYIARKTFGMRGMKEDRHITIRSCVNEFIKQQTSTQEQTTSTQHKNNEDDNNNNNSNILIPFPYK